MLVLPNHELESIYNEKGQEATLHEGFLSWLIISNLKRQPLKMRGFLLEKMRDILAYAPDRVEIFRGTPKYQRVMRWIDREIGNGKLLVPEGPPIHIHKEDEWREDAFINGWMLVSDLAERNQGRVRHFFLVDELVGRLKGAAKAEGRAIDEHSRLVGGLSAEITIPALELSTNKHTPFQTYLKRDFTKLSSGRCFEVDADFQLEKTIALIEEGRIDSPSSRDVLHLIIHPTKYREEQEKMLKRMVERMSKSVMKMRAAHKLISDTYRHIWLGQLGDITAVTLPQWDGGKFTFIPFKY